MIPITLPIRLVSEANARQHWAVKAKRVKSQRWAVLLALRANVKRRPALPVVVTLTRIAPRKLDQDNLVSSCKAVIDGLADWLGVDDRTDLIEWRYRQEQGAPRTYGVRIEVEAVTMPATAEGGGR